MCEKKYTISVIIPTYNRADVLGRAIDSVLNQTYEDYEIIIVDDCSDDNTKEVVRKFDDGRIKFIRHENNKGGAAARNTGIAAARGKYIAFLDSDDEWVPNKLQAQIGLLRDTGNLTSCIYTGYKVVREDGTIESGPTPKKKGDIYEDELYRDWVSPTSTVMVESRVFEKSGLFDPELPAKQDYDMWLRISQNFKFDFIEKPLAKLYEGSDGRITANVEARIEGHEKVLSKIHTRISGLPFYKKRVILSSQYYTIGRYCQIRTKRKEAREYFLKSIKKNPFNFKALIVYLLLLLSVDYFLLDKN